MTECPVKSLQGIQQDDTTFPALLYTPPLIESLANRPALLQDLPAWVSHSLFNYYPLLQEDPDFRVSPWETGRTCNGRRDVMSAFDALNVNISTFLRTHSAHWEKQHVAHSVLKRLETLAHKPKLTSYLLLIPRRTMDCKSRWVPLVVENMLQNGKASHRMSTGWEIVPT